MLPSERIEEIRDENKSPYVADTINTDGSIDKDSGFIRHPLLESVILYLDELYKAEQLPKPGDMNGMALGHPANTVCYHNKSFKESCDDCSRFIGTRILGENAGCEKCVSNSGSHVVGCSKCEHVNHCECHD